MISGRLQRLSALLLILNAAHVSATESTPAQPSATWEKSSANQIISIDLSALLSAEQQDIVNSGFSTFTILSISEKKIKESDTEPEIRVVCRVKYDTWEEKYLTTKIEPAPTAKFSGNKIDSWANQCLRHRIDNPSLINKLASGGQLFVALQVRQSSIDEAAKIKGWLVKQQSGLMQGLYSHMLGDLQLGGRTELTLNIPPRPPKPIPSKTDKIIHKK
jgi:hypothetical protein